MTAEQPAKTKDKLRWYQYSLRTLLIAVTLFAFACSWFTVKMGQAKRQQDAVEALHKRGCFVTYDYEMNSTGFRIRGSTMSIPRWIRNVLGDDFFNTVTSVNYTGQELTVDNRMIWEVRQNRSSPKKTDADFQILKDLSGTRYLHLEKTPITDAGLENLKGLKQLYTLDLSETNVSDAGLENLEKLKQLHNLNLTKTHVTDAGIQNLQKALPSLIIEH